MRVGLQRLRAERAVLVVEDGGPGLPIYGVRPQRFQRFDESRSRETGGSGLGMSIMADIAEALGGSMTTEAQLTRRFAAAFEVPCGVGLVGRRRRSNVGLLHFGEGAAIEVDVLAEAFAPRAAPWRRPCRSPVERPAGRGEFRRVAGRRTGAKRRGDCRESFQPGVSRR